MLVGDVQDLRAFSLACEVLSLTAVGKIMGESKATISRRISRLEAALGVVLLRRSSRGIAVTGDGAAYRARVAEVLDLLSDANAAATHEGRATPAGELRVSVPPGYANALAPIFAGFCTAFKEVVLVVDVSSRFVDLEAEHFDIALRATSKLADSSLVALRVSEPQSDGVFVASPAYLKETGAPRRPRNLDAHRIVSHGDNSAPAVLPLSNRKSDESLELRLPVSVVGSDLGFLKEMVLSGAGIAILPRINVQRELDEGRLVHVLPDWVWHRMNLFLIYRGKPFVSRKVRAFLDYMRSELSRNGALQKVKRGVVE